MKHCLPIWMCSQLDFRGRLLQRRRGHRAILAAVLARGTPALAKQYGIDCGPEWSVRVEKLKQ